MNGLASKVVPAILLGLHLFSSGVGVTGLLAEPIIAPARASEKPSAVQKSGSSSRSSIRYQTYSNARFQYSISYPVGLLYPQGEADNGDGQKFLSRDGLTTMLVYGSQALDGASLSRSFDEALKAKTEEGAERVLTFQMLKSDWFVVSGRQGEKIFYQKTMLKRGVFKTFYIEYTRAQKSTYDGVTARIARSFRG